MHRDEIYAALTELFRGVFYGGDLVLTPELGPADVPGWDSMTHINLVVAIERRFDIRLRSREIERLTNVGEIVRMIETKTATRPVQA